MFFGLVTVKASAINCVYPIYARYFAVITVLILQNICHNASQLSIEMERENSVGISIS